MRVCECEGESLLDLGVCLCIIFSSAFVLVREQREDDIVQCVTFTLLILYTSKTPVLPFLRTASESERVGINKQLHAVPKQRIHEHNKHTILHVPYAYERQYFGSHSRGKAGAKKPDMRSQLRAWTRSQWRASDRQPSHACGASGPTSRHGYLHPTHDAAPRTCRCCKMDVNVG